MAKKRVRRVHSIADELLTKSREAALSAVQLFNNPQIHFKSETFIVLMVIGWTYLLHAYCRKKKIEYRYFAQKAKKRVFDKTKSGANKYWELERCLDDGKCPIDKGTANNLRFLIKLRHEIEHQMTMNLDSYLSGRYQACALNFNTYIKKLFGEEWGIDRHLMYALQFTELSHAQASSIQINDHVPCRLTAFIAEFDGQLSHDEFNSEQFSYRLLFKKRVVGKPNQADKVIEFIDPNSDLAKQIDKEYWVVKEAERPKFSAKQIVERMQQEGYSKFSMHAHTKLWQRLDARNPGKGYGTQLGVQYWWYDRWLEQVREQCQKNSILYGATDAAESRISQPKRSTT
ncbi:DUF3644 domain-containing protein [Schlesneria sp.]|uniref:DUF3644 domain-containing protein n=1 Tax=Schlesneria sp. TaxID=2762018 RepID=UPI002F23B207